MTNDDLIGDVLPIMREAAALLKNPDLDARTEWFAMTTYAFAARVLDSYVRDTLPAVASITHTETPPPRPARNRVVSERRTRTRRGRGTPAPRVHPEAYVTNDAVESATEWWTSPGRTGPLRSGWGRRADCFLAATLLIEGGNEVTITEVANITGMQENNVSTKLTDLVVLDVLRRHVRNGHTYYDHSNWTKDRLK